MRILANPRAPVRGSYVGYGLLGGHERVARCCRGRFSPGRCADTSRTLYGALGLRYGRLGGSLGGGAGDLLGRGSLRRGFGGLWWPGWALGGAADWLPRLLGHGLG
ncbi:hypothetical protein ACGFK1_20675 [Mycobacterium sp. NPDC048908]|uniref:hypothetical protein n=1 Tax=Mycobacterium sp. NPDC048908 TaxID=3364292 RepID=UPI00371E8794